MSVEKKYIQVRIRAHMQMAKFEQWLDARTGGELQDGTQGTIGFCMLVSFGAATEADDRDAKREHNEGTKGRHYQERPHRQIARHGAHPASSRCPYSAAWTTLKSKRSELYRRMRLANILSLQEKELYLSET